MYKISCAAGNHIKLFQQIKHGGLTKSSPTNRASTDKQWVTHNAFSCMYMTLLGMTTIDTWKGIKTMDRYLTSVSKFVDILAKDIVIGRCKT